MADSDWETESDNDFVFDSKTAQKIQDTIAYIKQVKQDLTYKDLCEGKPYVKPESTIEADEYIKLAKQKHIEKSNANIEPTEPTEPTVTTEKPKKRRDKKHNWYRDGPIPKIYKHQFTNYPFEEWKIGSNCYRYVNGEIQLLGKVVSKRMEGRPHDKETYITFERPDGTTYEHINEYDHSYKLL